ncbi:hypothetical protein HID58_055540 [Brassica napus]|uniref:Uncharacterized protein n=1 Tax=Brassica napus TaxID=3708 RepID=A0ABQ8AKM2_BRANA|nr:hypothetical protein HID58_055540 [Brassica napus]
MDRRSCWVSQKGEEDTLSCEDCGSMRCI